MGERQTMFVTEALLHLRSRLVDVEAKDSRNRPHWSADDIAAVSALVERPAAGEQLALARIEGRLAGLNGQYVKDAQVEGLRRIACDALGLSR